MQKEHGQIVETAVEARGGFLGKPVLLVLLASILLVIVVFAIYGWSVF